MRKTHPNGLTTARFFLCDHSQVWNLSRPQRGRTMFVFHFGYWHLKVWCPRIFARKAP
jgi:hypothetical protein